MTVEDLIEELRQMPATAAVVVEKTVGEDYSGVVYQLDDPAHVDPIGVRYERGMALISIDEPEPDDDEDDEP
jgi:hypothetical protein